MTENEFFNILMDELIKFPEAELYDIVSYYQYYFSYNLSFGKSQEEIISELVGPHYIAEKIIHERNSANNNLNHTDYLKKISPIYKIEISSNTISSDLKNNHNTISTHKKIIINNLLKTGIIILSIVILLPVLAAMLFIIFNSCKICIEIIIESLNLAKGENLNIYYSIIPSFIVDFPKSSLILFSTGTILLSVLFLFVICYFLKLIFIIIVNLLKKFKENTGDL